MSLFQKISDWADEKRCHRYYLVHLKYKQVESDIRAYTECIEGGIIPNEINGAESFLAYCHRKLPKLKAKLEKLHRKLGKLAITD